MLWKTRSVIINEVKMVNFDFIEILFFGKKFLNEFFHVKHLH